MREREALDGHRLLTELHQNQYTHLQVAGGHSRYSRIDRIYSNILLKDGHNF